jgi:quinol-cytochrome oxidoreductase complex cytochrome b subunit
MPWWYDLITILFSLYYGIREIKVRNCFSEGTNKNHIPKWQRVSLYHLHDIVVQVIYTISGFVALFIANYILFSSLDTFSDITVGTAILLIFLIFWGTTGVSGYLPYLIVSGKLTASKPTQ